MRELYRRRKDGKFPVYPPEKKRASASEHFDGVIDETDLSINFDTHTLDKYVEPYKRGGKWYTKREPIERDAEKEKARHWQDVELLAQEELKRTDLLVLRELETQLIGNDGLKAHRQAVRDIMKDAKGDRVANPKTIKVARFKEGQAT